MQAKFVDNPAEAVHDANQLIKAVMQARGYPVEDFEHRVACFADGAMRTAGHRSRASRRA